MENIETKQAWYVTKEAIVPVWAFTIPVYSYHGATDTTYYKTEKGWKTGTIISFYGVNRDLVWTEQEAIELKQDKMKEHIKYLKEQSEKNAAAIVEMEKELEK